MGSNVPGLLFGLVFLGVIRLLFAKRGVLVSIRSSFAAAVVGSVVYPLLLCTFMGLAGAQALRDDYGWSRFKHTFATYAQAAPTDSIPRGAVMGVFLLVCGDLVRRMSASWRRERLET